MKAAANEVCTPEERNHTGEGYTVVVQGSGPGLRLNWRELWEYRDMLRFLVVRDFISKYKQTALGPLWFILQPLFLSVIFTVIFSRFAGISTDAVPAMLFYLCGQLGWTFFQSSLTASAGNLITNASLFKKVYFPRVIVPLASVLSNLIALAIQTVTFLGFWFYSKFFTEAGATFGANVALLLFPVLVVLTASISLGIGLWMSALSAKYRDLHHLTPFVTQVLLYVTPIIYPLSQVPEGMRWLVTLNPLAAIVETYRYMFLGVSAIQPWDLVQSAIITGLVLLSGFLVYEKIQANFVDYA